MTEDRKRELMNLLFQKKQSEMIQQHMLKKIRKWHEEQVLDKKSDMEIMIERLKNEVLIKSYEETTMVVTVLDINHCIDRQPTNVVYDLYKELCKQCSIEPMKKEYFSVFVKRYFDYEIVSKRIKMKVYRLFIKLPNT